ncbi:nitroreductase [Ramlibacter solisilvae]|uniref:Putative NAD(P)H nitroreductase n=1 Tax=Ramlibacter tataouinensis TaxID=94132 RepID=A0A127JY66_9BURK|nr:nitroreductase [Ramlibacter tataouinensis]AMO24773.1 nitroreductase [Ramlibacter tataouinensis]
MDARVQTDVLADHAASAAWAMALLEARQTILPKRLEAPGPDAGQLRQILAAAAHAPDHDRRLPWRFVIIPEARRADLAEAFAQALQERDAQATPAQLQQARDKAFRAPLLMLAVAQLAPAGDEIPDVERFISAGCAVQNMLLVATAQGYGSALTSGKAMGSAPLPALFGLRPDEQALCFISVGTPAARRPARHRPQPHEYTSELGNET